MDTQHVLSMNKKWMGVTYAADKPEVMSGIRALVDAGIYPPDLWAVS